MSNHCRNTINRFALLSFGALLHAGLSPADGRRMGVEAAPPAVATSRDQVVALLYLRRDNLAGSVRGEIYPLAVLRKGRYVEASVSTISDESLEGKPTPLETVRHYTAYHKEKAVGRFAVTGIEQARFQCMRALVGIGRLDLPKAYLRFDPRDPRVTRSQGGEGGRSFDYNLTYYLALSHAVPQAPFKSGDASRKVMEGRKQQLMKIAERQYARYRIPPGKGTELGRSRPTLEEFRAFDLDRDGKPELMGRFHMRVEVEITYDRGGVADRSVYTEEVRLMLWVRDHGPARQMEELWVQEDIVEEGSWGRGHELIEVMDLDGDGVAEMLFKVGGWETTEFTIYALRQGRLTQVFRGAGDGC